MCSKGAIKMKYNEIIARIIWTRQDIRQLLEDNGIDSTEEAVDHFLERLDHLQLEFRPYAYQQEILDNLEAEREVHGH